VVTAHNYGLFLVLVLVLQCQKITSDLGVGCVQFQSGANGLNQAQDVVNRSENNHKTFEATNYLIIDL